MLFISFNCESVKKKLNFLLCNTLWNRLICPFVSPYVCLYVRYESYFGERLLKISLLWRLNFCVFCLKRLIFLLLPKIANCLCYKSAAKCNSATSETTYLGSVEPKKKGLLDSFYVCVFVYKQKKIPSKPEARRKDKFNLYVFFCQTSNEYSAPIFRWENVHICTFHSYFIILINP